MKYLSQIERLPFSDAPTSSIKSNIRGVNNVICRPRFFIANVSSTQKSAFYEDV